MEVIKIVMVALEGIEAVLRKSPEVGQRWDLITEEIGRDSLEKLQDHDADEVCPFIL